MRQIKNVAALADTITSNGEMDQRMALKKPVMMVATTPVPDVFFQKKINKIIAENVFPTPAQAS